MDYEEAFNEKTLQLEPRLQEYCRKKEFNIKNKIKSGISEEQQYNITSSDIKTIKNYKTNKQHNNNQYLVKPVKFEFTDYAKEFQKDPRYAKIQKKAALHKKMQIQKNDMQNVHMLNSKDFMLNSDIRHLQLDNQNSHGIEHSRRVDDVIGNMDMYNKHLNKSYEYVDNILDAETRTFMPGYNNETKRDRHTSYNTLPFGYGNGLADISVENALKGVHRDTSKKTAGFRNTFENQFQYISSDISNPDHTVQMWPQHTRGQNKEKVSIRKY